MKNTTIATWGLISYRATHWAISSVVLNLLVSYTPQRKLMEFYKDCLQKRHKLGNFIDLLKPVTPVYDSCDYVYDNTRKLRPIELHQRRG